MDAPRFVVAGVTSGLAMAVLDGLVNANPVGRRRLAYLAPIARKRLAAGAGIVIDLAWGFAMAAIYLLLRPSLPGAAGLVKGSSFAGLAWFFRVLMRAASDAVMLEVPPSSLLYQLASGAGEMAVVGLLLGLLLG